MSFPSRAAAASSVAHPGLSVQLHEEGGYITFPQDLGKDPRHFRWTDIRRICFQCGRLYQPDLILLELSGDSEPIAVSLSAEGGPALMGQLVGRGLMPDDLVKRALGNADGGLYCWPELT